jgi:hypothetical protein
MYGPILIIKYAYQKYVDKVGMLAEVKKVIALKPNMDDAINKAKLYITENLLIGIVKNIIPAIVYRITDIT